MELLRESSEGEEQFLDVAGGGRNQSSKRLKFLGLAFVAAGAMALAAGRGSHRKPTLEVNQNKMVSLSEEKKPLKLTQEKPVYAPMKIQKDVVSAHNGKQIRIEQTGQGGDFLDQALVKKGIKDWEIIYEKASVKKLVADTPSLNVQYSGSVFAIVRCTLNDIRDFIKSNDLDDDVSVEEDQDVHETPELDEERRLKATWGLDRVNQRDLPLDGTYKAANKGAGVHIYIADTGVRCSHEEFQGRCSPHVDVTSGTLQKCSPTSTSCARDHNGHGTHCASSAAGKVYGVAPGATLHATRVLGPRGGMNTWTHAAIDYIAEKGDRPAVFSASLGGPRHSETDERIISAALNKGVVVVVAAGNEGRTSRPFACQYSPAGAKSAITVASSDSTDKRSDFSNWGDCVDIYAPGHQITAADFSGDDQYSLKWGTSMACPHVSGAAAILLASGVKPKDVRNTLVSQATPGKVKDSKSSAGTPNELLHVKRSSGAPAPADPVPPPPTANPIGTGSCEKDGWKVISGPCTIDSNCCLTSDSYPKKYGSRQTCTIKVGNSPGKIAVKSFSLESHFDTLTVNGKRYSGSTGPDNVVPENSITFQSDKFVERSGFKLCLAKSGGCDESTGGGRSTDYRGCQTKTRSGKACVKWTDVIPQYAPDRWPGKGLGDHNFCRNPDNYKGGLWCFVSRCKFSLCKPLA